LEKKVEEEKRQRKKDAKFKMDKAEGNRFTVKNKVEQDKKIFEVELKIS